MTNITLHPNEKDISVAVRKIKNACNDNYFYAIEITVNDTHVIIYTDKIKDIIKMTSEIDHCIMQLIDRE